LPSLIVPAFISPFGLSAILSTLTPEALLKRYLALRSLLIHSRM
jgi:hypothetical protein